MNIRRPPTMSPKRPKNSNRQPYESLDERPGQSVSLPFFPGKKKKREVHDVNYSAYAYISREARDERRCCGCYGQRPAHICPSTHPTHPSL